MMSRSLVMRGVCVAVVLALPACNGKTERVSHVETATEPLDPRAPPEVASFASDWPLPNFDYDNTRNSKTRIDSTNVSELRERWRFEVTGGGIFGFLVSNPLLLGSKLYFQDLQSNVYALERATGKPTWIRRFDTRSSGPNGVAIGWGKAFCQVGGRTVRAIDLGTGEDVWTHNLELIHSEGIDIQPTVFDGQVFASTVPVTQSPDGIYAPGSRGVLFSLDAESGMRRWAFDTVLREPGADPKANGGGGAWYPPLIDAKRGVTYWGTGNPAPFPDDGSRPGPNLYTSSVVALRMQDGTLAWYYQDMPHDIFDWDFQTTPVRARAAAVSGGDLVIGSGKTGAVAALDAQTGKLLWRTRVGRHENGELNGDKQPSVPEPVSVFPGAFGGVLSAMALADGVLYVPSSDLGMTYDGVFPAPEFSGGTGNLTAIDVHDGKVLWNAPTNGACYGAATLANDLVLTSDENGRVYAFARKTGREVWHYDAPGGINAPLVVAGDELFVTVGTGTPSVIALALGAVDASSQPDAAAGSDVATFTAVYRDILQGAGCSAGPTCHSSTIAGALNMSTPSEAYAALVGVKAMGSGGGEDCKRTGIVRVVSRDPDNSLLLQKLEHAKPVCGAHMPPGGMLKAEQIARVRKWIENGAPED